VPPQLPDTVGQSTLLAVCIIMILFVYNEGVFKAKPWLLAVCSFIIAFSLEVSDTDWEMISALCIFTAFKNELEVKAV